MGGAVDELTRLRRMIEDLERRISSMFREAVVTKVDPTTGTARVDAGGLETKDIPWLERAGGIKQWMPPTVGERVVLISPNGDPGQGMILPGGFSSGNPQPNSDGGEHSVHIGNAVIRHSSNGIAISVGGTTFEFTAGGFKQVGGNQEHEGGDRIHTGGSESHDGKNVGSTHVHPGVQRGGANTDPPA